MSDVSKIFALLRAAAEAARVRNLSCGERPSERPHYFLTLGYSEGSTDG